jgi:signal peptidase I
MDDDSLEAPLPPVHQEERRRLLRRREWLFLGVFLVVAILCWANFRRVVVQGRSMEPTYENGQTVLVWKLFPRRSLKPGDVIVFREGSDDLIKRVAFITAPGDTQLPPVGFPKSFTNPEGVTVSGRSFGWYFFKASVGILPPPPRGSNIYVMGDNFPVSDDSRHFGPINPTQILGRVVR